MNDGIGLYGTNGSTLENDYTQETKLGNEIGAQLILANDPDADRIGIAIRDDKNEWYYPNGNQVGLLLLQYLLNNKMLLQYQAVPFQKYSQSPLPLSQ